MAHPGVTPGPYGTPIPNYARYGTAGLLAKTAYNNALARISRQRMDTLRQYGYKADIDPNSGVLRNLAVDPHNAYGTLQTMFRNHALQDQEATYAAEERGLHGGLANKSATQLHYQHGSESSQLGQGLTGSIADYQDQQTQAAYERDRALYEAELEQARNAIANGNYNPGDPGGDPPPDDPTPTATGPTQYPLLNPALRAAIAGAGYRTTPALSAAERRRLALASKLVKAV
jgi:hypothetical protein